MYKLMYESSFLLTDMYMYLRKLEKYTCTLYINIYLHADLYTHTYLQVKHGYIHAYTDMHIQN